MDERTFQNFRTLIYEKSGITLGPQKVALVTARVGKRMRTLGLEDYQDYLERVRLDSTGGELVQLLDAISTNVTSFYREAVHFEILASHLQQWMASGQTRFRVWCAASSTGEEPYCLAMTCLEALQGCRGLDLRILATDISTRVLERARRGEYSEDRTGPVPRPLLQRYFTKFRVGTESGYRANDSLRRVLTFNRLNLAETPYPMKGPFDVIFCRNVMIYFDTAVRTNLVREAHRLLKPGGCLMIGHSESLTGLSVPFKPAQPAVYIRL
jgi:chemotaxis protein methyltransferase CheR